MRGISSHECEIDGFIGAEIVKRCRERIDLFEFSAFNTENHSSLAQCPVTFDRNEPISIRLVAIDQECSIERKVLDIRIGWRIEVQRVAIFGGESNRDFGLNAS